MMPRPTSLRPRLLNSLLHWHIWSSKKTKRLPHGLLSPVYVVFGIVFWIMWYILLENNLGIYDPVPAGYHFAAPLVVLAGIPFNLTFCWVWTIVFFHLEESQKPTTNYKAFEITKTQRCAPVRPMMPPKQSSEGIFDHKKKHITKTKSYLQKRKSSTSTT